MTTVNTFSIVIDYHPDLKKINMCAHQINNQLIKSFKKKKNII